MSPLLHEENPDEIAKRYLAAGVEMEQNEQWHEAVECYLIVLSSSTRQALLLYFGNNNLAYSLIQIGRYEQAEPYCHAAIAINDQQHNAHKNLGLVFMGQELWLKAALCFAKAYKLAPKDVRAWHLLNSVMIQRPELIFESNELREAMLELGINKFKV